MVKKLLSALFVLLAATAMILMILPVFAQQQPASNVALQINSAIASMALELDQARQGIAASQRQMLSISDELAKAQARIKELEPKAKDKE